MDNLSVQKILDDSCIIQSSVGDQDKFIGMFKSIFH